MLEGFANIGANEQISKIDTSRDAALRYLYECNSSHVDALYRSLNRWNLSSREHKTIGDLMGCSGISLANRLASNGRLRRSVSAKLMHLMEDMAAHHPGRKFYLVTVLSDRWLTYSRDTYIYLADMHLILKEALSLGGLDGWSGLIEIQTLDESRRDLGRILMAHGHAIAWTDQAKFKPESAASAIAEHPLLMSDIGVPTVDFSRRADTHTNNLVAYMIKAASKAKRRALDRGKGPGFKLVDTRLPPACAVRQTEILSHMYLDELMFHGGDGVELGEALKTYMDSSVRYIGGLHDAETSARFWPKVRVRTGNDAYYYPVAIVRDPTQAAPMAPISLHSQSVVDFLATESAKRKAVI